MTTGVDDTVWQALHGEPLQRAVCGKHSVTLHRDGTIGLRTCTLAVTFDNDGVPQLYGTSAWRSLGKQPRPQHGDRYGQIVALYQQVAQMTTGQDSR